VTGHSIRPPPPLLLPLPPPPPEVGGGFTGGAVCAEFTVTVMLPSSFAFVKSFTAETRAFTTKLPSTVGFTPMRTSTL
jgi:hypothetical protein